MYIKSIAVKNFRLLASVELHFEKKSTVIVGRNNSGKTSLTELFRRLLSDKIPSFQVQDFSLCCHELFWKAFTLSRGKSAEEQIREALPLIEVQITMSYEGNMGPLGPLSDFVIDLNPSCTDAVARFRYQIADGKIENLFSDLTIDSTKAEEIQKTELCKAMIERVPKCFTATLDALDPSDATNIKSLPFTKLRTLLASGFINAQRGLDDITHKEKDVLGRVLETLLTAASAEAALPTDKAVAEKLKEAVKGIQENIDLGFKDQLKELFPAFSLFGYPGLGDPQLLTETTLDVTRLLSDHTRVHYKGLNGINLPESYNGLGTRNLIFILLKLLEFFKAFNTADQRPGMQIVFIEEPEVHLHPQMQEVFVSKLSDIADEFAKTLNNNVPWPVQFVLTTHSSHVANSASFDAMRYFLVTPDNEAATIRSTEIKNVRHGLGGTPKEDLEFLHKYLTLTRCDLFFADKAILIEGPTERLLLPMMIQKLDAASSKDAPKLSRQYLSIVEVGGAYAHLFFKLIEFLELRTLVITDIDSVKKDCTEYVACEVAAGTKSSNACINKWFEKHLTPVELIAIPADQKAKGFLSIAYQVPEAKDDPCGRSFEDAFMLANGKMFGLDKMKTNEKAQAAYQQAEKISKKKTDFALKHAIGETDWSVPKYLADGLTWLAFTPKKPVTGGSAVPVGAAGA